MLNAIIFSGGELELGLEEEIDGMVEYENVRRHSPHLATCLVIHSFVTYHTLAHPTPVTHMCDISTIPSDNIADYLRFISYYKMFARPSEHNTAQEEIKYLVKFCDTIQSIQTIE